MAKQAINYRDEYRRIRRNYLQYIRRHSFRGYVTPPKIPKKIGESQVATIEKQYEKLKAEAKTGKVQKRVEKARKQAVQRIFHVDISKIPVEDRHPIFLKSPKEMEEWQAEFIPRGLPTPTLISEIEEKIRDWTDYSGELMVDDDLKRDIQNGYIGKLEAIEAQEERDRDEQQRAQEEYDAFRRELEYDREQDERWHSIYEEGNPEGWETLSDYEEREIEAEMEREREEERKKIYESIPEIDPYEDTSREERRAEENLYPWAGQVILDNLREEIESWNADPSWSEFFKISKEIDRNKARNILEGAVSQYGEEVVAMNCEGNATKLHNLLDFILYGSEGRAKASIDSALVEFMLLVTGKTPTAIEAMEISDYEEDKESDE